MPSGSLFLDVQPGFLTLCVMLNWYDSFLSQPVNCPLHPPPPHFLHGCPCFSRHTFGVGSHISVAPTLSSHSSLIRVCVQGSLFPFPLFLAQFRSLWLIRMIFISYRLSSTPYFPMDPHHLIKKKNLLLYLKSLFI